VIVAHLGSGASMCALANGRSVESTMGFTALDGIPMGSTRPGQIDPGVLLYLLTEKGMDPMAVQDLLYRDSGLKGLSGISNDMIFRPAMDNAVANRNKVEALGLAKPGCYDGNRRRDVGDLVRRIAPVDQL
jgi:acetate kinase